MKRTSYFVGSAILLVSYLSGCGDNGDDLLADYKTQALSAENETAQFRKDQMTAESVTHLRKHIGAYLKAMRAIRTRMMDQCRQDPVCPEGGGATGVIHNGHMSGGQYLDRYHMNMMVAGEDDVGASLESMHESCNAKSNDAEACWGEYSDMMKNSFNEMVDTCNEMMSDHIGSSGMMGGGSGMMGVQ